MMSVTLYVSVLAVILGGSPILGTIIRFPKPMVESVDYTLNDDFNDFKSIIIDKSDEIQIIFEKYYLADEQFRTELEMFYGDEMKELIQIVDKLPEYEEFIKYLYDQDVKNVYTHLSLIHELLGIPLPPYIGENLPKHIVRRDAEESKGLKAFIEELKAIIDTKAFVNLYNEKLENSEPFKEFVEYLKSEKFLVIVNAIKNDENYKKIVEKAIAANLDVEGVRNILNKLFGW